MGRRYPAGDVAPQRENRPDVTSGAIVNRVFPATLRDFGSRPASPAADNPTTMTTLDRDPGPAGARSDSAPVPRSRVLVADDDGDVRRLLVQNLDLEGYDVTACDNGEDARELARTTAPDVIVLDVMMPKRDGYDVLAALKSSPATRGIPVVLLSAKASDEDVWHGWRAGADYYVTKPFNLEELLRFIEQAIDSAARSRG